MNSGHSRIEGRKRHSIHCSAQSRGVISVYYEIQNRENISLHCVILRMEIHSENSEIQSRETNSRFPARDHLLPNTL